MRTVQRSETPSTITLSPACRRLTMLSAPVSSTLKIAGLAVFGAKRNVVWRVSSNTATG